MKTTNYLIVRAVIRVMLLASVCGLLAVLSVPPQIGAAVVALAYVAVFGAAS